MSAESIQQRVIPGISETASKSLLEVFFQVPEIKTLILYGSRAKGQWRQGSDIDLCIKDSAVSLSDILSLEVRIDDLLLPYKIDLACYESIENAALREHIDRVGLVLLKR